MKAGARALGFAESYSDDGDGSTDGVDDTANDDEGATDGDETIDDEAIPTTSTLAGAVVRADRVADDLIFGELTVGGLDSTDAIIDSWRRLDRPDVSYVLLAGVAPAWYNLLDLPRLHEALDRPVLSVSFEASEGLDPALREQFDGDALETRLARYQRQPPRRRLTVNGEHVFVRAAGCADDEAATVVRAFTPEGGRPEPLRVARLAARAADDFTRKP